MGNIPAYAGKTLLKTQKCWFSTEHPRVCGENLSGNSCANFSPGTSPRMRGKPAGLCIVCANRRNIPAYAGKTGVRPGRTLRTGEHPRVCGENLRGSKGWRSR